MGIAGLKSGGGVLVLCVRVGKWAQEQTWEGHPINATCRFSRLPGSGKTYTMSGREEVIAGDGYTGADTHDGIISRAVQHLFGAMAKKTDTKYALSASYLEIYNEGIYDLLNLKVGQ